MALTIENATIGFDATNVEGALRNLNTRVINDTIKAMNSSMGTLREAVDAAWVGQSAETFKNNMEADKDSVTKGLEETFEALKTEMYEIVNKMGEADAELVKERGAE